MDQFALPWKLALTHGIRYGALGYAILKTVLTHLHKFGMSESDQLLNTLLNYYSREGYFQHVQRLADNALQTFVNDPTLQFYYAFAQLMQNQTQEALRAFSQLAEDPEVSLGAICGMIQAHKDSKHIDKEALSDLEGKLRDGKRTANDKGQYFAGKFYFFIGETDKAREFVEKAIKAKPKNTAYLCLKGFNDLEGSRDIKAALKCFEDAIAESRSGDQLLDAYLGQARYHEKRQNPAAMIDALNVAAAKSPNFLPVHMERMKAQLMAREWDQCAETAQRCQVIDPSCIEAQVYSALYWTCFEGKQSEAEGLLADLAEMLNKTESKNCRLYVRLARLFSAVAGRNTTILTHTKLLCEKSMSVAKSAESQSEYGRQLRLLGQTKAALRAYKTALETQADFPDTLLGIAHCHILDENVSDAEAQLEFTKAAQADIATSPQLQFLEAMIAKRKSKQRTTVVEMFLSVANAHFSRIRTIPFGPSFFAALDADFILELVQELFDFVPIEAAKSPPLADPILKEIQRILTVITDALPGICEAAYLLGKAKYLSGETDAAQTVLQQCLNRDQAFSDAHLLMAQIHLQKSNFKLASQSLEIGLSFNFQVRDHPLYHLIKARIQKRSNFMQAAVTQLETAMALPGFKRGGAGSSTGEPKKVSTSKLELTEGDRVSIYLELIDCLQALERTTEATKLMHEALTEFHGTKEEEQLMICNADLALTRGDADKALEILKSVGSEQPSYLAACQKMAEIYLHHKKDKRQFAICYKDLVEKNPTPQAFVLLGDAYMSIQEPERAIEVYEAALKRNPKDHALARKIGAAYVQAHLYSKAVNYYEAALKTGQQNFLRQDLADLLFKLKNYDKCEKVLKLGLERQSGTIDVPTLIDEVKFLVLLAKLYFEVKNAHLAVETLLKAKEQQIRVLKRGPSEIPDMPDQRALAAKICKQLGEYYENQRELQKATGFFKEALIYNDNDSNTMLSLAHLYLTMGELDECNLMCETLLKVDKGNDQATLMLADLMYQKNSVDTAMFHFQQLLDRNPNQYHALARLVELTFRNGDIEQADKYLKLAMDKNPRASLDPGFNYCKGVYDWYTGDPNCALQHFNRARRDLDWGEKAIYNMIEICLNPDNEIIGGEVFEHDNNDSPGPDQDATAMGVRTAERFLKELRFKPGLDYKYRLMENFILLATKNKTSIEEALNNFTQMAGGTGETDDEVHNIGAILGLARGYMILKQTPKAKAQLKRIIDHPWTIEEAVYLQECWLLLADTYINQGKYEAATGVLRTCLQHNASCTKAFEYMGFLREKEQKWTEAAANYEEAWKLSKRRNPAIGYKLGYNYLKSKRLVDAIDVCHRVLELYPSYPKIRRDILDKARANLRM